MAVARSIEWAAGSLCLRSSIARFQFESHVSCLIFVQQDVLLHFFQVNIVVELNDVPSLARLMVHYAVRVDCVHVFFEFEQLGILADNEVERDVLQLADLHNAVDCAHDELVQVSIHE